MNGCKLVLKRIFCLFIIFSFILFGISQNRIVIEGKSRSSKRMDYKIPFKKGKQKRLPIFILTWQNIIGKVGGRRKINGVMTRK